MFGKHLLIKRQKLSQDDQEQAQYQANNFSQEFLQQSAKSNHGGAVSRQRFTIYIYIYIYMLYIYINILVWPCALQQEPSK